MNPPQTEVDHPSPGGPLRVLWLIKGLGPGGAEYLLVAHARVSDPDAFRYEVASVVPWKDQLVPSLDGLGVTCTCLGVGRRGGWRWPLELARLVRGGQYDVVHAHSPLLATAARVAVRTLPRGNRPAMVTTEHNVWNRYAWPTRLLNAATSRMDDQRWAVSERVSQSCGWIARHRTPVLVHGVVQDDLTVAPGDRERVRGELGLAATTPVVITVANLRDQKDYPNLLQAAQQVLRQDPSCVFLSVGQGPLEKAVEQLRDELELGDRFRFLGYRTDVPQLLAAADLFVLASKFEGYPLAVMEALTMGLPVVSTNVGGVPDTIDDGVQGLLVPPRRPDLLAEALVRVIRDDALRARMAGAAVTAGARFDISNAVRDEEAAYRRLSRRQAPAAR